MSQVATCTSCEDFSVPMPLDPIGVSLMQWHLKREHGILALCTLPTPLPRAQQSQTPDDEAWWYDV